MKTIQQTLTSILLICLVTFSALKINAQITTTSQWTWVSGNNFAEQNGVYGTKGTAAASNIPGGRYGSVSWKDASGNVWLFGGYGAPTSGHDDLLNDLWKYNTSTGQWTWVSGDNTINQLGVYGTQGTAAASNKPGARQLSISWTDASGNLWLFGGYGYAASGSIDFLNDLWKYNTSTGQWTWVSGDNIVNQLGVYGTKGTAAASNKPGARQNSVSWTDASGNLWLLGGNGYAASGGDLLNDLWKYNTSTGQWTWVSGDNTINQFGVYGTKGTAAASNKPGARRASVIWTDASGNLWLFGGLGYAASGGAGRLDDLWKYNTSSGQWTWVSGDNTTTQSGIYGTKGTAAASNKPGARIGSVGWTDASGNLWLFGGYGFDRNGTQSYLNDLWKYNTSTGQWTWISGDNTVNQLGVYGTKGTPAASNKPGSRQYSINWTDASGNLWLFGGQGYDARGSQGSNNDLWKIGCTATASTFTTSACGSYTWAAKGNKVYTASNNTDTIHLTNEGGCDSLVTLNLTIKTPTTSSNSLAICPSALPYSWNGSRTAAGTYTFTTTNSQGCDSVATFNLTINQVTNSITNVSVCSNQLPYSWNGTSYNATGTYTKTGLVNVKGCDSSATLNLTVVTTPIIPSVSISTASTTVCDNVSVAFTASSTTGGSSPIFQWKKNGVNAGVGTSISFTSGTVLTNDIVSCLLTANNGCQTTATATSNAITLTVKPSLAIGTSSSPILCALGITTSIYNSNTSGGGVWISSNPSIATVSTANGAVGNITTVAYGVDTVTYSKTNTNGCLSSVSTYLSVISPTVPNAIAGSNNICPTKAVQLSTTPTGGVWSTTSSSIASVNATGVVTGNGPGVSVIKYTLTTGGCVASASYNVTVNSTPTVPSIQYVAGTSNPQTGAGGAFCVGKVFKVVGSPSISPIIAGLTGVWRSSNLSVMTVTAAGSGNNRDTALVSVLAAGTGSITYTVTSPAGCVNSRSVSGVTVATCFARSMNVSSSEKVVSSSEFTMYPNPAKTFISLNVSTLMGSGSIVLTDLYGKQVKTQPLSMGNNTIDIAHLSKGFYMVSIITNEGKTTKKLIVE